MKDYYFNEFEDIKEILKNSQTSYNINNISKELLLSWKDEVINTPNKLNKREFVTEEIIVSLANTVHKKLLENNTVC